MFQFYYYFAIIEDFVLRFIWGLSFVITQNKWVNGETMATLLAILEVCRLVSALLIQFINYIRLAIKNVSYYIYFRRFIWNFFRLENEHLNNCGQFRAVRDISVAPIDSSDQNTILRMMDEENGVINRYSIKFYIDGNGKLL